MSCGGFEDNFDHSKLLIRVARDFVVAGTTEPVAFHPLAPAAIADAIELSSALSALGPGIDDLLLFAYDLEGAGDSPGAARALREIIARSETALAALELVSDRRVLAMLEKRGKRLARTREDERLRSAGVQRAGDLARVRPT